MKQSLKQQPKQNITLTPLLQNQIKLLSLAGIEVRSTLSQIIEEFCEEDRNKEYFLFKDIVFEDRYNKLFRKSSQPLDHQYELPEEKDIKATLLDQLYVQNLKDHEILIGEYLIDSINRDGRLDNDLDYEDISLFVYESLKFKIGKKEIEKTLYIVQSLEPIGCAYRNILESLFVQTDHLEIQNEEKIIIKDFLKKFSEGKTDLEKLNPKIKKFLKLLRFNPCIQIDIERVSYIRPDLIVIEDSNTQEVTLNDPFIIESLTQKIKALVKIKKPSTKKKNEALSFVNGLERRQKTLLEVGKFLVSKQKKYLMGSKDLVPLSLKQISIAIGVSESTVSRIVQSKYLQLPKKIIPLSSLLEKRVTLRSSEGKQVSPSQLKKLIKDITQLEKRSKPYSDKKIQTFLKDQFKVTVARRTVTKYRQQADILSSNKRMLRSY